MPNLKRILFGRVQFDAYEEYSEFQHHFLGILIFFNMVSSTSFLIANATGANRLPAPDILAIRIHLAVALVAFFLVRNIKRSYRIVAVVFGLVCIYVCAAALIWVPDDELRVLWLFLLPPGFYLLLGRVPGVLSTIAAIGLFPVGNRLTTRPYSPNAIATGTASLIYISAFFYAYSHKAMQFFLHLRSSQEQLAYLASHDPLTGACNARSFREAAERTLHLSHRDGRPSALLFVDLDHFKKVNDTYGHETGDAVLKRSVEALQGLVRRSDVLGRVGGEEFAIFLPDTNLNGALVLGEKLRQAVSELEIPCGEAILRITASIGAAYDDTRTLSIAQIQRQADEAMYAAKKQGRNRVCSMACGALGPSAAG